MKKIFSDINKIATGLLFIGLTLTSCKKLIEIPANPPSSITQEQQYADSLTSMSAVAGVYAYNTGNGFAYSDGSLTTKTGLSSDELSYVSENDNQQFYSYTLTPLNAGISSFWSYSYQSIYQVNAVLNGVTNNSNLSASFQKKIIAEMKVVRALYYFNLINLYGDAPLVTSIDYSITSHIARTPVTTVYQQIKKDLADARQNLTTEYPSVGRARPNLYTAIALQAKVNLYQKSWQMAYNEADSVIRSGDYSLENTLNNVFLSGSSEAIWQLPAKGYYYAVSDAWNFLPSSASAAPNYLITDFLLNAFKSDDRRLQNWIASKVVNGRKLYYPFKYKNIRATATPVEDQMIFRLAEMYLIRAEAAAHLNNLHQALDDVNTIRTRAGLQNSTVDPASQIAVLGAVMLERQTELFCEWGNRWYDLKRTGAASAVLGAEKTGYTDNASLYPIPQAQRQLNKSLTQNPGYN